jgi:concanavalin A-like lectin/glucanase superfamily protein
MTAPRSVTANFSALTLAGAPAAYWKLDEGSGATSFADASGNGNNGACGSSCPTMGVPGKLGTAASFNGINSQITVPDSPALRLNQFTIALWVYPTQVKTNFQPLVVKEDSFGNNRNYGLFIVPNTMQIRYAVWGSDCVTRFAASSVGQLTLNAWNHLAFTYDGTVEKLYLNGALDSSNAASAASLCQAAVPVKLGMETSAFLPFNGTLDEVGLYTQALSAAGVLSLYDGH